MPCFSYRFTVPNPSQSIEKSVTNRIYGKGRGSVFTPNDFLDLGSRGSILDGQRGQTYAERYMFLRSGEINSIDWVSDPDGDVVAWAGTNPPIEFRGKTLDDVVDAAIVFHDDSR